MTLSLMIRIGRHGVHIALGLVDKVEVDRLPHRLLVQRVIRVGLDIVPRSLRASGGSLSGRKRR